jgi:uridine kinase
MNFDQVAHRILVADSRWPLKLIAVDGCAGSGKSTFARNLAEALGNAPILEIDDFISNEDLTGWWPRLEEQVLTPLFQGKGIRYQARDWEKDYHGNSLKVWKEMPFSKIVLLEGIGSSRKALASRLSYSIWVEAPQELRLKRGLERDQAIPGASEVWRKFQEMEKRFFEVEQCRERAHLIVDGTAR